MATQPARQTLMPIPPVAAHTRYFEAGPVTIGIEYRLLTDAIVAQHRERQGHEGSMALSYDDHGVSLHILAPDSDGEPRERLRFDCFDEAPHYHYVDWQDTRNDIVPIDPVANGDPLAWALERIRTRLPQMLIRAGASATARAVDMEAVEAVLPRVCEAAYTARYQHDDEAIAKRALG